MGGVAGWHPGGVTASDRFHLTLAAAGRPAMHGWWARESTARIVVAERVTEGSRRWWAEWKRARL